MKKKSLFTILAVSMAAVLTFVFSSCSKDDDGPGSTTYTFVYNSIGASYLDNVKLFECTENGDKIKTNTLNSIEPGRRYDFTASDKAVKVKVYLAMGNSPRWVQQVYYLNMGSNTVIELTDDSVVGTKEP